MTKKDTSPEGIEGLEIKLLLESIYLKYGYDFRGYSQASLKRRIRRALEVSGCKNISEMQHKILYDGNFFSSVLNTITITVTELYRDPAVYLKIRNEILPYLRTYPEIKIWHAGCATGEEVYSLAILLHEENLLDRCIIYGTDINQGALKKAKEGIFSLETVKGGAENYLMAGGKAALSDYYTAGYGSAILDSTIKKNLVFSDHNLATDSTFGEMNLILCRNVLIYFDATLQAAAVKLLVESLTPEGFLVLGTKESLTHMGAIREFTSFAPSEKIYRKKTRLVAG